MADLTFADEFLPVYDVSDAVATVAGADRETTCGRCSMSTC